MKITSLDLRIGNFLTDNRFFNDSGWAADRIYKVQEIKNNCIGALYLGQQNTSLKGIRYSSIAYEDLAPLLITKELIFRCEFVLSQLDIGFNGNNFMFSNDFVYSFDERIVMFPIQSFAPTFECQYVHELQNLYLSIKKKELLLNIK